MLSQSYIEELTKSERKDIIHAALKCCDGKIRKIIRKRIFPSSSSLAWYKHGREFSPNYENEMRKFLESDEWLIFFFLHSVIFRTLCLLGLEDDMLLQTFIFLSYLKSFQRRIFFEYLFTELCRKKGKPLPDLIKEENERMKKRQKR